MVLIVDVWHPFTEAKVCVLVHSPLFSPSPCPIQDRDDLRQGLQWSLRSAAELNLH